MAGPIPPNYAPDLDQDVWSTMMRGIKGKVEMRRNATRQMQASTIPSFMLYQGQGIQALGNIGGNTFYVRPGDTEPSYVHQNLTNPLNAKTAGEPATFSNFQTFTGPGGSHEPASHDPLNQESGHSYAVEGSSEGGGFAGDGLRHKHLLRPPRPPPNAAQQAAAAARHQNQVALRALRAAHRTAAAAQHDAMNNNDAYRAMIAGVDPHVAKTFASTLPPQEEGVEEGVEEEEGASNAHAALARQESERTLEENDAEELADSGEEDDDDDIVVPASRGAAAAAAAAPVPPQAPPREVYKVTRLRHRDLVLQRLKKEQQLRRIQDIAHYNATQGVPHDTEDEATEAKAQEAFNRLDREVRTMEDAFPDLKRFDRHQALLWHIAKGQGLCTDDGGGYCGGGVGSGYDGGAYIGPDGKVVSVGYAPRQPASAAATAPRRYGAIGPSWTWPASQTQGKGVGGSFVSFDDEDEGEDMEGGALTFAQGNAVIQARKQKLASDAAAQQQAMAEAQQLAAPGASGDVVGAPEDGNMRGYQGAIKSAPRISQYATAQVGSAQLVSAQKQLDAAITNLGQTLRAGNTRDSLPASQHVLQLVKSVSWMFPTSVLNETLADFATLHNLLGRARGQAGDGLVQELYANVDAARNILLSVQSMDNRGVPAYIRKTVIEREANQKASTLASLTPQSIQQLIDSSEHPDAPGIPPPQDRPIAGRRAMPESGIDRDIANDDAVTPIPLTPTEHAVQEFNRRQEIVRSRAEEAAKQERQALEKRRRVLERAKHTRTNISEIFGDEFDPQEVLHGGPEPPPRIRGVREYYGYHDYGPGGDPNDPNRNVKLLRHEWEKEKALAEFSEHYPRPAATGDARVDKKILREYNALRADAGLPLVTRHAVPDQKTPWIGRRGGIRKRGITPGYARHDDDDDDDDEGGGFYGGAYAHSQMDSMAGTPQEYYGGAPTLYNPMSKPKPAGVAADGTLQPDAPDTPADPNDFSMKESNAGTVDAYDDANMPGDAQALATAGPLRKWRDDDDEDDDSAFYQAREGEEEEPLAPPGPPRLPPKRKREAPPPPPRRVYEVSGSATLPAAPTPYRGSGLEGGALEEGAAEEAEGEDEEEEGDELQGGGVGDMDPEHAELMHHVRAASKRIRCSADANHMCPPLAAMGGNGFGFDGLSGSALQKKAEGALELHALHHLASGVPLHAVLQALA